MADANWWDRVALEAQGELTRDDESSQNFEDLEWPRVKRAVIHTRYDMVLLAAYLSAANVQLAKLIKGVRMIAWLLGALIISIWLR